MANQGRIKFGVDFNVNQSGLNTIKQQLQNLQNLTEKDLINIDASKATQELDKIHKQAKIVEDALDKSFNKKLNTNNISVFTKELEKSKLNLKMLSQEWSSAGITGQMALNNLTASLMNNNRHLRESSELLDKMANTMANTIRWSIASTALNKLTGEIQKAYSFTKQLDRSLNDISIVTDKSSEDMARFAKEATQAAKALGAVTTDYTKASLIFYQQGLSDKEVAARAATTTKVANVTGQSADQVSEQLTAVWNGYKVSAEESELYIDKLAKVAASTAADLEELSTGMSKVASAANIMGVDIDQLNAQLATIVSVTREAPESIGTALKTVYARMSDIEAGLDTETTLGEYTKQMAQMGINVLDAKGNLRDMGEVVEEIGDNWNNLNRNQQAALAQTIAGTRQYSRMMALFDNWDMYQQSKSQSINATGTVQKQNEKYLESLDAHLNKLQVETEELYQTLFNADDLNPLIDGLTSIVSLTENFIEGLGGGKGLLGVLGTAGLTMFGDKLASGMAKAARNTAAFVTSLNDAKHMQALMNQVSAANPNLDETAVEGIVRLKKEQLQIEKYLTEEQRKQAQKIIANKAQAENDKLQLQEKQKQAKSIQQAVLGKKGKDLSDTQAGAELAREADSIREQASLAKDEYSALKDVLDLQDKEIQARKSKAGYYGASKRADDVVNKIGVSDEQLANAISKRFEYGSKGDEKAQVELELHREKLRVLEDTLGPLEEYANKAKNLSKVDIFDKEEVARLKEVETLFKKLNDTDIEAFTDEDIVNLNAALRDFIPLAEKGEGAIRNASKDLPKYNQEMDEVEKRIKAAEEANKKFVESFTVERIMGSLTNITTAAVSLGTALQSLDNLDDIWSDEDLTAGEKMLQTFIALSTAAGTMFNAVKSAKEGFSEAFSLFGIGLDYLNTKQRKATAETMANTGAEAANASSKLATAAASKAKTNQLDNESNELRENTVENIENTVSENTGKNSKFKDFGNKLKTFGKNNAGTISKIGGIVAAAAIVIAGTIAAFAAVKAIEDSISKEFEKASERAQMLKEHLGEVQAKTDELDNSISRLQSAEDAFDGLTKGTIEWQKALNDVNNEVLSLLKEYPELMNYVRTNENGVMSIDKEGLELVQQNQLKELQAAQAGSLSADLREQEERIKLLQAENSELMAKSLSSQELGAAAQVAAMGAAGAIIGGVSGGPWGAALGAGIGVTAGTITAGTNYALQENEEKALQNAMASGALDDIVQAYQTTGKMMFESEQTLAAALNKDVSALTDVELALLDNKDATLELIDEMASYEAQMRATLIQIGTAIVGADATTGEKIAAGKIYRNEYGRIENELTSSHHWYSDDMGYIREAIKLMGLSESDIIGRAGVDTVKYKTAGGEEATLTVQEAMALIAEERAMDNATETSKEMQKAFKEALADLNKEVRDLASQIGTTGFSLTGASYGALQEMQGLSDERLQSIATGIGESFETVKASLENAAMEAAEEWEAPAGLEGEVLSKFQAVISNIDLTNVTLPLYTKFAGSFEKIWEDFGQSGVNTVYTLLSKAGDKSDDLLNEIASLDWTSDDLRQQFNEILSDLDISVDGGVLNEFMKMMRTVNGLYGESIEGLKSLNASVLGVIEDLTQGSIISAEQFKTLTKNWSAERVNEYFAELQNGTYLMLKTNTEINKAWAEENSLAVKENISGLVERRDEVRGKINTIDLYSSQLPGAREIQADYQAKQRSYVLDNAVRKSFKDTKIQELLIQQSGYTFSEDIVDNKGPEYIEAYLGALLDTYNLYENENIKNIFDNMAAELGQNINWNNSNITEDLRPLINNISKIVADGEINKNYAIELNAATEMVSAIEDKLATDYEGKTKEQFEEELQQVLEQIKESYDARMQQTASFAEVREVVKEAYADGVDYTLQKNAEVYNEAIERIGMQTLQSLEQFTDLPVIALDEFVAKFKTSANDSGEALIQAYEKAFNVLIRSSEEFDIAIKQINKSLEELGRLSENLGGQALIDNIAAQLTLFDSLEAELTNKKEADLNIAENIIGSEIEALGNQLDKAGYNFVGADKILGQLISAENGLNETALLDFKTLYASNMSKYQNDEDITQLFEKIIADAEKYGEDYEAVQEQLKQVEQDRLNLNFELLERELELKYDILDIDKRINEINKTFAQDNDYSAIATAVSLSVEHTNRAIEYNKTALTDLEAAYTAGSVSQANYLAKKEELLNADLENYEELKALYEELEQIQLDAIQAVTDAYGEQADMREKINASLEKEIELSKLIGGDNAQVDYTDLIANQVAAQGEARDAVGYWQSLIESDDFASFSQEYQDTIIENFQAANEKVIDLTFELMETREQEFIQKQDNLINSFLMPEGRTLEGIQREWEWVKEDDDKYITGIEKAYAVDDIAREFEKASNSTTSAKVQAQINSLRDEELKKLKEKDKLTQYDLDRASARLRIMEAEIALQDAQENKTKMRLMRGADGSYSYQYTADMDAIAEKEKELADANQALYTLDKDAYRENLDEFYALYTEWQTRMHEAYADGIVTEEETAEMLAYQSRLETVAAENAEFQGKLTETTDELVKKFSADAIGTVDTSTTALQTMISTLHEDTLKAFDEEGNRIEETTTLFEALYRSLSQNQEEYRKQIVGEDGNGGDAAVIKTANEAVQGSYQGIINKLNGEDGLITATQNEADATSDLALNVGTLATNYDTLTTAIQGVIEKYEALKEAKKAAGELPSSTANSQPGLNGTNIGQGSGNNNPPSNDTPPDAPKSSNNGTPTSKNVGVKIYDTKQGNLIWGAADVLDTDDARNGTDDVAIDFNGTHAWVTAAGVADNEIVKQYASQAADNNILEYNGKYYVVKHGTAFNLTDKSFKEGEKNLLAQMKPKQYKTGGLADYTGTAWLDGTKARPELVLNQDETQDFIKALDILRSLNLSMLQSMAAMSIGNTARPNGYGSSGHIEQTVHIQAEFPNVTNSAEIEEAFKNLSNLATQHAFENKK